ncbi:unnamed protein product [Closterium sp. Naga37s-1]|nr:unnamed protein product [Closterium sp. Naga37s-1]
MVSPREQAGFSRRLASGAVLLAAAVALLLLPCADAARKDTWSPRTFTADPFPVPPPDWQNLPFLRRQESARRRLLSGGGVSRPHWMPASEYTLPWMLGDRKPLIPTDPSEGEADVAEAAATSSGNDGWLGASGAGVASAAAASGGTAAGAVGGTRYSLAQRKGVCSPVTPASPRILVTTEADFVKRLKYSRKTTVLMTLKADIMLKKGLAFGPYYSCTILQADVTGNLVNTPVYLINGAVGVQIVNNFLHQFSGNGVLCGTHVNNAGSCMMTFIGRNWFFPNVTITAKTDIANIRFTTHWISPGNAASCNYMLGGNSCFNLEADTTGVVVLGGACMGAFNGVNIENGKENRIQYVWVKDYTAVPGSATCPTVTSINCNTATGKLWESKRVKYYNSPAINKRWPYLSNICKSTSIGTVPCNVPTAGMGRFGPVALIACVSLLILLAAPAVKPDEDSSREPLAIGDGDQDAWMQQSSPLSLIEDLFPTSPALSFPYRLLKSTPAPTKSSARASSPARGSSAPASDKKGSGKKLQQSGKSASEGATSAGAGTALSTSASGKGKRGKQGKRGKRGKKGKGGGAVKASETNSSLQSGKKKAGKKGKKAAVSSGKTGSAGERKKGGHKWPRDGTTGSSGERKKGGHKWVRKGTKQTPVKKSGAKTANAPVAKKAVTTSPASGNSRGRAKSGKGKKKRRTAAAAPAGSASTGAKSGGGKGKATSGKSNSRGGSAPPAAAPARPHKKGKTTKHSQEVGTDLEGKGSSNPAKSTNPPASSSGGSAPSSAKAPKGSDSDGSKAGKAPKPSSSPTSSPKPTKDKNSDSAKADSGSDKSGSDKSGSDAKPSPPSSPTKPSTGKKDKPSPPADTSGSDPASSPPATPVPKMICEKHKGQQLMVMDGNLFFTGNVEKCEGSCIKDSSCLMYTFSGLSCQLFTANMTARPVKACFSRKCQWGKCRDTEGDGSEEDSSGDGSSGGDTGGADESGGGDDGGDSSGGDSTGDGSTSDSGDDSSSDGATIDYGR